MRGNCQKCFPFCNCCSSDTQCGTCTKTLAKNHRRLRCNSCSILHHNKCGQVEPTKFKPQFQSIITTWICPRCVTKSLLAELPMAGIGNTSCESLFLDEGEVKVRMYGEDFDSSQLSELAGSELPDCEGIVVDCPALTASQLIILSSGGCVFFFHRSGQIVCGLQFTTETSQEQYHKSRTWSQVF